MKIKINNIKYLFLLLIILLFPQISLSSYLPTVISNLKVGDALVFDGLNFTNVPVESVFTLFLDDATQVIPPGVGPQTIVLDSLLVTPNTSTPTHTDTVTVNNNTLLIDSYMYNTALGGTKLSEGLWQFDTYASVNNTGGTSQILIDVYKVISGVSDTITITGSGTSRTALTTGETPFIAGDANVAAHLSGYLQTPNGHFQITAFGGTNTVTIETLSTYTNETLVNYYVHRRLFEQPTDKINDTNIQLLSVQSTQLNIRYKAIG